MKTTMKIAGTSIVLAISIALSLFIFDFGSKTVYQSSDFQKQNSNGIRVVDYVQKRRADIYGDDSNIIPHPYLLYTNKPGYRARGFVQHDANGYRIVPQPIRLPGDLPKKVLILGGSTSYSYPYVSNPADAWPSVLQKLLGPRFEVINAGLSSATSAEILAGYIFRYRYLKPDFVIVHVGGTDVSAMMFKNYDPEYAHFRAQGTRPVPGNMDLNLLKWGGWTAKLLYAENWNEQATVFVVTPDEIPGGARPEDAVKMATDSPTEGFERNLALLVRNIRDDGATAVLFGEQLAIEKNMARNRPDLIGREHAWSVGLERNLDIMKKLAAAQSLLYFNFKPDEDWFLDNAHLNEAGEAAKAQFVKDKLESLLSR